MKAYKKKINLFLKVLFKNRAKCKLIKKLWYFNPTFYFTKFDKNYSINKFSTFHLFLDFYWGNSKIYMKTIGTNNFVVPIAKLDETF